MVCYEIRLYITILFQQHSGNHRKEAQGNDIPLDVPNCPQARPSSDANGRCMSHLDKQNYELCVV